jgi:hypothetical protein
MSIFTRLAHMFPHRAEPVPEPRRMTREERLALHKEIAKDPEVERALQRAYEEFPELRERRERARGIQRPPDA